MNEIDERAGGFLCFGASAGGLRSLEAVLSKLPASFPWPIFVSQHMQREHASLMPEILSRATKLIVREAVEGETPAPGIVYTCPSTAELGVSPEGQITLRAPVEGRPQRIDHLFSTASFARPGLVIAVVLSGTGTDGAAGSLVVKLNGGTVIAESDESAQQSGMPRAAVRSGSVDVTRAADAIAPLVLRLAEGGLEEMTQAMRRAIGEIAKTLAASSGTDFTHYRSATLRRRIQKRSALVGVTTLADYHALLKGDAAECDALAKSLLLPVTEFFRDPLAWEALAREVLAPLVERALAGETIRVWCAGCASGEEAYSMAIAFAELGAPLDRIEILATDLDPDSVERATAATYDPSRMANVDAARRARFFQAKAGSFRVADEILGCVELRTHDLTRDAPPAGPFHLVACRNVLIYFDDTLQTRVLAAFETCMAPAAALFLGRSTTIPTHTDAFEPIARTMRIFRSRRATGSRARGATAAPAARTASPASGGDAGAHQIDAISVEDSDAIILVVDPSWRITLASSLAREALGGDVVGKSLLDILPRWQGSPVHDALRATMETGRSVRLQGVPMPAGYVDLTLEAVRDSDEHKLFLVATPAVPRSIHAPRADSGEQHVIRKDLVATNDELQTVNEELAAANEELQATNEELASLNEEFLSTNQNLASANAEMQASIDHAQPSASQLHAIVLSRGDAVVACDAERRLTLMTPKASSLLSLGPAALGRPLDARALGIAPATLDEWLDAAAEAGVAIERGVATSAGGHSVRVEFLAAPNGSSLGWLLSLSAPPRMPLV